MEMYQVRYFLAFRFEGGRELSPVGHDGDDPATFGRDPRLRLGKHPGVDAAIRAPMDPVEGHGDGAIGQQVIEADEMALGRPAEAIVDFLLSRGVFDLLVVGFKGHSALYHRILGKTGDRLVELAPCAVLVVK
jgi:hypothetical protein